MMTDAESDRLVNEHLEGHMFGIGLAYGRRFDTEGIEIIARMYEAGWRECRKEMQKDLTDLIK